MHRACTLCRRFFIPKLATWNINVYLRDWNPISTKILITCIYTRDIIEHGYMDFGWKFCIEL